MNYPARNFLGITTAVLAAISLRATPVTVQEVGTGAGTDVYITSSTLGSNLHVFAGVIDLKINGSATNTQGFCIDPWHYSVSTTQNYQLVSLDAGPLLPDNMGTDAARQIEELWNHFYTSGITNTDAAALQIEIWKIVDLGVSGGTFSLVSASSSVLSAITTMNTWLTGIDPNGTTANLVAVTKLDSRGVGQDYVIPNVPDGGTTVALVGLALIGLLAFRRKFRTAL